MSTASLLDTVARHETTLMSQRSDAKSDARREIEEAHAAGAAHAQKTQHALEANVTERRRAAAETREAERRGIENQTAASVSEIRAAAAGRMQAAKDEMLSLLLPKRKQG